jgi:hypothetical protein
VNTTAGLLPIGFEDLEPFVAGWAIEGTAQRAQRRFESTREERAALFAAAKDRILPALDLLDRKPLAAHDACERRLMHLMLSVAHVALAEEVQGPDEEKHRLKSRHMVITRSVTDHDHLETS